MKRTIAFAYNGNLNSLTITTFQYSVPDYVPTRMPANTLNNTFPEPGITFKIMSQHLKVIFLIKPTGSQDANTSNSNP